MGGKVSGKKRRKDGKIAAVEEIMIYHYECLVKRMYKIKELMHVFPSLFGRKEEGRKYGTFFLSTFLNLKNPIFISFLFSRGPENGSFFLCSYVLHQNLWSRNGHYFEVLKWLMGPISYSAQKSRDKTEEGLKTRRSRAIKEWTKKKKTERLLKVPSCNGIRYKEAKSLI